MTKTVALADDAFQLLKKEKRPGESFSQLARRMVAERRHAPRGTSIMEFAGAFKDQSEEWEGIKRSLYRERRRDTRPKVKLD